MDPSTHGRARRRRRAACGLAALAAVGAITMPPTDARAAAPAYTFRNIDPPGAATAEATGVNNGGTVVGSWGESPDAPHAASPFHGFVLDRAGYRTLDKPGTDWTYPQDISDSGEIVGFTGPYDQRGYALDTLTGFRYDGDGFSDVVFPGSPYTFVMDGNDQGDVVGFWVDGAGYATAFSADDDGHFEELRHTGAESTYATAVNELGRIVTFALGVTFEVRDATWTPVTHAGASSFSGRGSNNRGDMVGQYTTADGGSHGCLLRHGVLTELRYPGAASTVPNAINDHGDIVGQYLVDGVWHAFLATPSGGGA
jgi:uncharacterized membrane protein